LLLLCRPAHWTKNLLILLPVAVALGPVPLVPVAWSVLEFTLASSLVYIGNDLADRHRDRLHPVKQHRPIASGLVSAPAAAALGLALAGALGAAIAFGPAAYWPVPAYLALNAAYTAGLKHVPLVEVGVVAAGYLLRIGQGFLAIRHPPDSWLLLSVFCCCALLVLGKRRHELLHAGPGHRPALRGYSVGYLDALLQLACCLTVISGLLFVRESPFFGDDGQAAMLVSAPLALFAISRYLQAVVVHGDGGDPVRVLLHDRPLVITSLLWGLALGATAILARHPGLAQHLTHM
jgi:4-hydroxybenzoate polyprenyltransferase